MLETERLRDRGHVKLYCAASWMRCCCTDVYHALCGCVAPTADDFFARQVDAWVDGDGVVVDPDGGLDDDYDDALAASWGDEAWDDADVY